MHMLYKNSLHIFLREMFVQIIKPKKLHKVQATTLKKILVNTPINTELLKTFTIYTECIKILE